MNPGTGSGSIRVGIGGWSFDPWRETFYPSDVPKKRELEYASRALTTIEINSTFYRQPAAKVYAQWREQTPDGFVFSLKAPRRITQRKLLAGVTGQASSFIEGGLAELGDRLGPVLWQLATTTVFNPDDLNQFLDALPRTLDGRPLRHVLEVRHDSFACEAFVALARAQRIAVVYADTDDHPSFADVTGDCVYVRAMRAQSHLKQGYPSAQLDAWAERAKLWAAGGEPDDVPRIAAPAPGTPRDVFLNFISAAKERNPAAAMGVIERLLA